MKKNNHNNKNFLISIIYLIVLTFTSCTILWGETMENTYPEMFDSLWKDFDETYALFEIRNVNWEENYKIYKPKADSCTTDQDFFQVLSDMLYTLKDAHVYIKTPFDSMNAGDVNTNLDIFSLNKTLDNYIANSKKCGENIITYGTLKNDETIGYIHIAAFNAGRTGVNQKQDWANDIDIALDKLKNTKCLILDVRGNRGGLTGNVSRISGRFCAQNKTYALSRTKCGPEKDELGSEVELCIKRNGDWQYTKPVYLLTNAQTMSAGEEFVMALKTQDHVTQIGSPTCGVFSLSLERCLVNGWKYSVSVQQVTDANRICHEGKGLIPSTEHLIFNQSVEADLQLEHAVTLIQ